MQAKSVHTKAVQRILRLMFAVSVPCEREWEVVDLLAVAETSNCRIMLCNDVPILIAPGTRALVVHGLRDWELAVILLGLEMRRGAWIRGAV
jgi:hypothetical protein